MKKGSFFVYSFLILVSLLLYSSQTPVFAKENNSPVIVSGTVKDNFGNNVKGADVQITCNGKTIYGQSDAWGHYAVGFSQNVCGKNNTVNVFVYKNNQSGYGQGNVNNSGKSNVDVSCGNNPVSVPEFGIIQETIAALVSLGSFFLLRKKLLV